MGTETVSQSEQALAELAVVASAAKGQEAEENTARKKVTLEEVQTLLDRSIPAITEHLGQAAEMIDEVMSFATTSRFPGNAGMEHRMITWKTEAWPSLVNDLYVLVTELESWNAFIGSVAETRDLRKQVSALENAMKKAAHAANAEMVTGKPVAKKAPAKNESKSEPEAAADDKPAETRRSRKAKAEEPVAA